MGNIDSLLNYKFQHWILNTQLVGAQINVLALLVFLPSKWILELFHYKDYKGNLTTINISCLWCEQIQFKQIA